MSLQFRNCGKTRDVMMPEPEDLHTTWLHNGTRSSGDRKFDDSIYGLLLRGPFLYRKGGYMTEEKKESLSLTKQEETLIRILREIEFGEARIVITDGRPIRIEEIKKSIKL